MKTLHLYTTLLLIAVLNLTACSDDDPSPYNEYGSVEFVIDLSNSKSTKLTEDIKGLIISVSNMENKSMYNKEELEVFHLNGSYITAPLSLLEGEYLLKDFYLVDSENNMVYFTPKFESEFAYLIDEPLDIKFSIKKDNALRLNPEIVSTKPIHEYILVEGGTFQMGDEYNVGQQDELPVHTVNVSSFQISKYEVTQTQFLKFLNAINCNDDGTYNDEEFGLVKYIIDINADYFPIAYQDGNFYFKGSYEAPTPDCPAIGITWFGANAYCKWAGGRLPTEAEWEFAARGGKLSEGYKYSGSNTYDEVAWNRYNSGKKTHPVGLKDANELGIYDMSGNAWEWCSDWYGDYPDYEQTNPTGAESGTYRVNRGASHLSNDLSCRVANRHDNAPGGYAGHGIRIFKSVQ